MTFFHVDTEKCTKDSICVKVCPTRIISLDDGGLPQILPGREADCLGCGHCVAFCPHQACSAGDISPETCRESLKSAMPDPNAVLALCQSRRSVRLFTNKIVDHSTLEEIMEAVRYAPTASNRRHLRWIMVTTPEKMRELGDLLADWMSEFSETDLEGAARIRAPLLVSNWRKGNDVYFRGAHQLMVAVGPKDWSWLGIDGAIALTYLELMAHARGVGCCWGGYFTSGARHSQAIREALGLGADEAVAGAQMMGYPALAASLLPTRKALELKWL